jgi:type I restriction enzyme S subunit
VSAQPSPWLSAKLVDLVPLDDKVNYGVVQPGASCDDGIPLIRVGDLDAEVIDRRALKRIAPAVDSSYSRSRLRGDEVLLACVGSIGTVALADETLAGCNIARAVARIRCGARIDRRFLAWYLRSPACQRYFLSETRTVAQPTLNIRQIEQLVVPLPPPPEQRRIADILDKADAIRRKRKEAIALTEELLRSAFLEMFGDPVTNPKGWDVKPLGTVIDKLEAGWSANGESRRRLPTEYGVLKISAVTSGIFRPEEHKAVYAGVIDRELVTPKPGDLLFSRANTRELVAATCLVDREEPMLFLPDKIWRIVLKEEQANGPYLRFLLAHEQFRGELTKTATGTSGSMLNVSMEKLRSLRAPVPSFSLQQRFADFVWKTLRMRRRLETAGEESDRLFHSLVQRAFAGELYAPSTRRCRSFTCTEDAGR